MSRIEKEYNDFMNSYQNDRKYCPTFGAVDYSITLVGCVLDMSNKESYKDFNKCECMSCGSKHIFHNRVANKEK